MTNAVPAHSKAFGVPVVMQGDAQDVRDMTMLVPLRHEVPYQREEQSAPTVPLRSLVPAHAVKEICILHVCANVHTRRRAKGK